MNYKMLLINPVFHVPLKYMNIDEYVRGDCSVQYCHMYVPKYIQQDQSLHNLFISVNCSTCFGWIPHPSSGVQNCIYSIWYLSNRQRQVPDAVDTVVCAPDDCWRHHPKHVEQFTEINKLCNVAPCWLYFVTYLRFTDT